MKIPARLLAVVVFALVLGLVLGLVPTLAFAGPGTDTIKKGNERFQDLLAKKVDAGGAAEKKLAGELTADMRELFDIEGMVEQALVDHWAKMKPAERQEVVETLREIIERLVKQLRANFKYQVTYDKETPAGESCRSRPRSRPSARVAPSPSGSPTSSIPRGASSASTTSSPPTSAC